MPQKRSLPILRRVSKYLRKFSKMRKSKLKLMKNRGFLEEFKFSSTTHTIDPLIHYRRYNKKQRIQRGLYSMMVLCRCLQVTDYSDYNRWDEDNAITAYLPSSEDVETSYLEPFDWKDDDDDESSVDQRAERFIERFYQEMRMQRQNSVS
ncbi:hypothetical protein ACFE04_018207 [Oxalis oulophora]